MARTRAAPTWWARTLAFDRAGLQPTDAARAALGIVTPLVVGAATGHAAEGAQAAAGALPVGVAAMTGTFRAPTGLMVATTVGMTASTFIGSLVAGHRAVLLATLAGWGLVAGLVVTLGRAATVVGVQSVVAFVVFGRYPGGVALSATHAGWVLAGGALQTTAAHLLRPPMRLRAERAAVAAAYDRLARLADGVLADTPGAPAADAIATAAALIARRTTTRTEGVDELRGLVDEARRMRLELQALSTFPAAAHVSRVTAAAATWLRELAELIGEGKGPGGERPELSIAVDHLRAHGATTAERFVVARAAALLGQLRAADRLTDALGGTRRVALPRIAGVPSALELTSRAGGAARRLRLAVDPRGSALRHGIRLAVLLPVASLIGDTLPWPHGWWVPLTTLVVLKPDYAATMQRGVARVMGTGGGVIVAGLLVGGLHPRNTTLIVLVAVFAWASYAVFSASYAVYTFVLTGLVVLLVSTFDPRPLSAVADRGVDTLIGGALALVGYAVWPTREAATLRTTTLRLLDALAGYAAAVLDGYASVDGPDTELIARRAADARRARTETEASLERALAEPQRVRADTETAASVLAASRRIVITVHALRTTLQDSADHITIPEASSTARTVEGALRALAQLDAPAAELRSMQQGVAAAAVAAGAESVRGRRLAVLAAHLDPLVDSIDTVAHVLVESGLAHVVAAPA